MFRTCKEVDWVRRLDGEYDQRYSMPQVINHDGSRDRRFNLFEQPSFGLSSPLTYGRSKYYESMNVPSDAGVYQIMATLGAGRPAAVYTGMSNDLGRRLQEHGRGGADNIAYLMDQAAFRGMDTRYRFAPAGHMLEARAQELYLLNQRPFPWNSMNNGGINRFWYR